MSHVSAPTAVQRPVLTEELFLVLLRCEKDHLDAFLGEIDASFSLGTTKARVHCRYVLHDGNERPRIKDLARHLAYDIVDFAIPRSEIDHARRADAESNSTRATISLHKKAAALFSNQPNTGEGGELLLYALAQTYLGLPQVLCKMPLKTHPNVHVHGSDGIHATVDPSSGKLALYWGESKLYGSVNAAIKECFTSLSQFLLDTGGSDGRQRRDLELLSSHLDLNDESLERALLDYLNPESPNFRKVEYRGLCLVGFDSNVYPSTPNKRTSDLVRQDFQQSVASWSTLLEASVAAATLDSFVLEVFCLPMPAVQEFRDAFLKELRST
jgi:hypothetical protein